MNRFRRKRTLGISGEDAWTHSFAKPERGRRAKLYTSHADTDSINRFILPYTAGSIAVFILFQPWSKKRFTQKNTGELAEIMNVGINEISQGLLNQ